MACELTCAIMNHAALRFLQHQRPHASSDGGNTQTCVRLAPPLYSSLSSIAAPGCPALWPAKLLLGPVNSPVLSALWLMLTLLPSVCLRHALRPSLLDEHRHNSHAARARLTRPAAAVCVAVGAAVLRCNAARREGVHHVAAASTRSVCSIADAGVAGVRARHRSLTTERALRLLACAADGRAGRDDTLLFCRGATIYVWRGVPMVHHSSQAPAA